MRREALAILLFLSSLLNFHYFLPLSLVLLGFISYWREWKIVPIISILIFITSFFYPIKDNAIFLTLIFPLLLIRNNLISSTLFSISVAFLPFGTENYVILLLVSILLIGIDYRGTIVSGILLIILSALGLKFVDISFFYLLFGVFSAVFSEKIKIRKEHYLSIGAVLFPLLHQYLIPSILLSIGFGIFFPFSLILSSVMFYFEGFKYWFILIPFLLFYLYRKGAWYFLSTGIGLLSIIFPPLFLFLFVFYKLEKKALLLPSILLPLFSIYMFIIGNFTAVTSFTIASILLSSIFIASRILDRDLVKQAIRNVTFIAIAIIAFSAIMYAIFHSYWIYVGLFTLGTYTVYKLYDQKYMHFALLVLLSFITKYYFISLSGYSMKNKLNIAIIAIAAALTVFHFQMEFLLATVFSLIAYGLQFLKIPKFFSFIPPVFILATQTALVFKIVFAIIMLISGYLIGRKYYTIGLIYEISLGLSLQFLAHFI